MSGFSEITSAMYHDAQATIATQAAKIEALRKALDEIAEADWPGTPANHRLSKAREVARAALSNTGKK